MELPNRPTRDPYQEIPVKDFSYVNTQQNVPKQSKRLSKNLIFVVAGLAVLVLIGLGVFLVTHHSKAKPTSHKTNQLAATSSNQTHSASSTQLTTYTSVPFNLTVSYPSDWSVSSQGNTSLSISSPVTSLTDASGKSVMGKEVVTVLSQGQIPAGFGTGAVAVLNSQDITFTKPTSSQAAQTFVSFAQYSATTIKGGLDALYITGNNGYVKTQPIPASDIKNINPLIMVSFSQCQTSNCSNLSALTIASTMWSNSSFSTPILTILKSFSFS